MKQNLLNKLWLRVCMIAAVMTTALAGTAAAEEVTYTVTAKDAVSVSGTAPTGSSVTYSQTYGTKCQATAGNSFTLTLSGWDGYTISNITLSMKSNTSKGAGALAYSSDGGDTYTYLVGSGTGTTNVTGVNFNDNAWNGAFTTTYTDISKDVNIEANSSDVIIHIRATTNSLYCESYKITYAPTSGGSSDPSVATSVTIDATGITNTDVYAGTAAGSLAATVVAGETTVTGATVTWSGNNDAVATIDASTGAVTLVAAGTVTFTAAYAGVENTYKASSKTYTMTVTNSDPNAPGTEANPYTVAEARAAIDAGSGVTEVYATGIVTAIPTAWSTSYNNITFNLVDAEGDEDFLQAFRCKSTDAADASTVAVGDIVVVKGNLTKYGSTYEFAQGCELISLTKPVVTVEAPIFSPEGGVYTEAQTVSIAVAAPTMDGYSFYYTTDGTEPTTSSTLYTAPIEISTTTTLKAIAVKDSELSTVTTAVYAILAHAGTEADPYTVADARAAIDANAGLTDVYATGIVSEIPTAWSADYSNITFNFVDAEGDADFLQAYRCASTDAADASAIAVGDVVVVKGTLKKYNSTYEFGQGCELVSLTHSGTPAEPVIVAEDATIAYDATYYELIYEIQNPVDGTELTATTTASWITSLTPSQKSFDRVMIECEANDGTDARTATIVLAYGNVTKEVTLTQETYVAPVEDYAELPFSFDGGKADIENTDGFTYEGLGSDYSASPKLKFDGTGDNLVLAFNERPGVLTFDIKGNGFSGGTFKVQASADGTTYTDVATYTELGATETKTISNLAEDVRYIMWVYTEKSSGNVALGNINLAKYGEVVLNDYYLTIANPENITITAAYDQDVLTNGEIEEVTEGTEVTVALTVADGYDLESVTVNGTADGQAVTLSPGTTEGVYTFTMPAFDVTVSATAVEHVEPGPGEQYALFTGNLVEGDYIIYYEGYAMSNEVTSGRLQYEEVTPQNDVITTSNPAIVWHIAPSGENWTIYSADANAYAASTGVKNKAQMLADGTDDMALWTITVTETNTYDFVSIANANSNVNAYLRNNGTYGFACYAATTGGALSLYKKVGDTPTPTVQTVTVSSAGYATMVAQKNLEIPTDVAVEVYAVQVVGYYANLIPVTDGIPAGEAVLVKAAAGEYNFLSTTDNVPAVQVNDLVAATTDVVADGTQFILAKPENAPVGFYQATGTIPAGKAYLSVTTTDVKAFTFTFEDDDPTGINAIDNGQWTIDNEVYNLAGQRIQKLQRGINIVGGKKILK